MSGLPFIKMHGAGNDYVFVDGFDTELPPDPSQLAVQVSNRNFGIGSDGLILLAPASKNDADVEMRMFNADGSEGDICGNGVRCVVLWMSMRQRVGDVCRVQTKSRIVTARVLDVDLATERGTVCVDMGVADKEVVDQRQINKVMITVRVNVDPDKGD